MFPSQSTTKIQKVGVVWLKNKDFYPTFSIFFVYAYFFQENSQTDEFISS